DMDVTDEGDYTLHITDDNGCESSGELTLSHLPSPDFSLGNDREKCPGDTIMIETDPSFTRYEWNGDTSDDQPHFTEATSSGNYTLRVWNEEGCSSEEEVDITLRPAPDVDLGGDREACAGETFELEVGDYEEIYWTNGDKDVRSITASEGRHGVLVVNEYGCAGGDTIHVNWHPVPDIDLGPDLSICPADYPVTIEAPAGFERYQWQTGSNSRRIHAQLRDTVNKVNVWDENNCRAWDTKGVKTINEPGYSLGEDIEACEPEEVSIDAGTEIAREYGGEEDVSNINEYEWNTGSSNQEITVNESGQYHVEVFDGCFYLQDTVQVEYFPAPEIVALDTSIYAQVRVLTEDGTKPYRYALDDDSRMQDENTFKNVEDGTHTVYVEDDKECRATTEFSIQSEYDINVPGFFTPNNDGFNDTWEIEGIERLPESVIFIFDRYGKLLLKYKASDQPWDGEYMGRPVPSDDYWYVIHLKPVNKYLKGNVTIKR
ncbi:MAG: T9SS type B sorting domain-containing protein, partial [Marinilabiliaceae bacterium]